MGGRIDKRWTLKTGGKLSPKTDGRCVETPVPRTPLIEIVVYLQSGGIFRGH